MRKTYFRAPPTSPIYPPPQALEGSTQPLISRSAWFTLYLRVPPTTTTGGHGCPLRGAPAEPTSHAHQRKLPTLTSRLSMATFPPATLAGSQCLEQNKLWAPPEASYMHLLPWSALHPGPSSLCCLSCSSSGLSLGMFCSNKPFLTSPPQTRSLPSCLFVTCHFVSFITHISVCESSIISGPVC